MSRNGRQGVLVELYYGTEQCKGSMQLFLSKSRNYQRSGGQYAPAWKLYAHIEFEKLKN